jgi:hypothetical protein
MTFSNYVRIENPNQTAADFVKTQFEVRKMSYNKPNFWLQREASLVADLILKEVSLHPPSDGQSNDIKQHFDKNQQRELTFL